MTWYVLTDSEIQRHNPPELRFLFADDGTVYSEEIASDDWLAVGYIPMPRSRPEWFAYHLIHGLAMRYPFHKVLGFAICNTHGRRR